MPSAPPVARRSTRVLESGRSLTFRGASWDRPDIDRRMVQQRSKVAILAHHPLQPTRRRQLNSPCAPVACTEADGLSGKRHNFTGLPVLAAVVSIVGPDVGMDQIVPLT
jgi:hypothetical protein